MPGKRYGQSRPVYILTSEDTFSAGEDFAYALKNNGRALIVGETTGGGAHPGSRRRLTEHFMMNVPMGRSINPVTHTDWEGVGVAPDLKASAKNALDVAQVAILEKCCRPSRPRNGRRRSAGGSATWSERAVAQLPWSMSNTRFTAAVCDIGVGLKRHCLIASIAASFRRDGSSCRPPPRR